MDNGKRLELETECKFCYATGVIDSATCPECNGTHFVPTEKGEEVLEFLQRHFTKR